MLLVHFLSFSCSYQKKWPNYRLVSLSGISWIYVTTVRNIFSPTCWYGGVFQCVHGFPGAGSAVGAVFPGAFTALTVRYLGGGTQRVSTVTGPVLYASIRVTVNINEIALHGGQLMSISVGYH